MGELVPGGNLPLPDGELSIEVPGPFDLSALITGDDRTVDGDQDFVFYNQPSAPGARLRVGGIQIHPQRLRAGASRITVVISPADPSTPLGRLPAPVLRVTARGALLATFTASRPTSETVLVLAEIYRRGAGWKLRAIGQGYADGLAGLARDFGIEVTDDGTSPVGSPAASAATPPAVRSAATGHLGGFTTAVNSWRSAAGIAPIAADGGLTAAAQRHAAAMAAQRRLDATGPDGKSVFEQVIGCGYAYLSISEDLVSGPRTLAEFTEFCLGGGRPRDPVRDPRLCHIGIGHAADRGGETYWTAVWTRPFSPDGLARFAAEVISLTNAERARAGLRTLAGDPRLAAAAQDHSADMVARGYYSHTCPEGRQPWDRAAAAGCTHRGIGENIACGQRSPAEVVRGWMNSPPHRANILKPDFTHIGIGFVGGGQAGTYWTQLFGMSN